MGLDVVVLRLNKRLESLEEFDPEDTPVALGTPAEIREHCRLAFPGVAWSTECSGLWLRAEECAIEFDIPAESSPASLHLTIRMGSKWDERTELMLNEAAARRFAGRWKVACGARSCSFAPLVIPLETGDTHVP